MRVNDTHVLLSSLNKTSNRLKYYGEAKLANLSLLKLIYKYCGYSQTYKTLQRLDEMVAHLQLNDKDISFQIKGTNDYSDSIFAPTTLLEGSKVYKPVSVGGTVSVEPETYTFKQLDFITGFTDADGDKPTIITIKTLPANGTLLYSGESVTVPFSLIDATKLTYTRNNDAAYNTSFSYTITDSNCQIPMESNVVTMTVQVQILVIDEGNEPPVIGDRAVYVGNRVVTVFTVADFTTETIAPYFDPENNDLDAIRIDEVSTANTGVYYYLGSPVSVGQIITNAEIASGAFYHEGPDSNAITTDSFNASVRDTGSMIWVQ